MDEKQMGMDGGHDDDAFVKKIRNDGRIYVEKYLGGRYCDECGSTFP